MEDFEKNRIPKSNSFPERCRSAGSRRCGRACRCSRAASADSGGRRASGDALGTRNDSALWEPTEMIDCTVITAESCAQKQVVGKEFEDELINTAELSFVGLNSVQN